MAFDDNEQQNNINGAGGDDTVEQIPQMFLQADGLLFKERNFSQA